MENCVNCENPTSFVVEFEKNPYHDQPMCPECQAEIVGLRGTGCNSNCKTKLIPPGDK